MQADMQKDMETYNEEEFLDLGEIAVDYLRCIRKYWILFGVIIAFAAVLFGIYKSRGYEPGFRAKVTYSVRKTGDSAIDNYTAKYLNGSIGAMTSMPDFKEDLLEEAGLSKGSIRYSISSEYTTGSRLFTVIVYADDYQAANRLLKAFEAV